MPGRFKSIAKRMIRSSPGAMLVAALIWWKLERIGEPLPGRPSVLVLNQNRWRQDLAALVRTRRLNLRALDVELQGSIYRLFPKGVIRAATEYFLETDPTVWHGRAERVRYLQQVIRHLSRWFGIRAVITPAIHYRIDLPWAEACRAENVPFIALHKEFTVIDERQLPERIGLWRERQFRFLGHMLCVSNENARRLFCESGVVDAKRIRITGVMRIDNIARADSPYRAPPDASTPTATLFSFGHLTGPFATTDIRSHYFSRLGNEGFVELFRDVHVAFAELALENPGTRFRIKLKNHEPWWIGEIEAVLHAALGRGIDDIPNLELTTVWAPELIQASSAVIALNSTVVLESRLLGRNTILPVFAEAAGRYDDHVYFHRYHDLFPVATSKDDLKAKVQQALSGCSLNTDDPERLRDMFTYYLGGDDGRAAERAADAITECIVNPDMALDRRQMIHA